MPSGDHLVEESVDSSAYWTKLKERLKKEGNEPVTHCHGLKMVTADQYYFYNEGAPIDKTLSDSRYIMKFKE